MNSNTPPLPKPQPETLKAITPPWYARASTGTAILAVLAYSPNIVAIWVPILSDHQKAIANAVAGTLVLLTAILEGRRGPDAAGRVAEMPGNGGGVVTGQE